MLLLRYFRRVLRYLQNYFVYSSYRFFAVVDMGRNWNSFTNFFIELQKQTIRFGVDGICMDYHNFDYRNAWSIFSLSDTSRLV